jgi:3-deoxy-manno-octulosonate cytidylyltransferase (CMP-KDO synthetase)
MGSSRFPGKPLAPILGIPMIEHVYRRTELCGLLADVYVATCDAEIREAVDRFGGNFLMTSDRHERASDRVAEAAEKLDADIIVMIQGDEPMTVPEMIGAAVQPMLDDPNIGCVNLFKEIENDAEHRNPNTIKVVMDARKRALYFSRQPIPTLPSDVTTPERSYKQVCVIPFRRELLFEYTSLPATPLEKAESVDMLRLLEHGYDVHMVETEYATHAVDTAEDRALVEKLMRNDHLLQHYSEAGSEDMQ